MPFISVSANDFEQVNVCWVLPYQFINAEIIYCHNYFQIYKNLNEIEVHKKKVWFKVIVTKNVFACRLLHLVTGNIFFSGYSISLFHKNSISQWM